jgi:AraC family transcriptional regulator
MWTDLAVRVGVSKAAQRSGDLHGNLQTRRKVGGFAVTESGYPPKMRIRRHDHELASICIVLAGGYEEGFGGQSRSRRAAPGVVIVHPEGEHHEEAHDPIHTRLLTVEIETDFLRTLRPAIRALDDAWHRTDYVITALAYRLRSEIARDDSVSALVVESSILEILAALDRVRPTESGNAAWLRCVRELLEVEFQNPPSMRQLSTLAGVHPVYLARAFRRRYGCSVGSFVRRLQVGKACVMLEDQATPLSTVAMDAGFADQSHMTRRVLDQTGLTPGAWRRRGTDSRSK